MPIHWVKSPRTLEGKKLKSQKFQLCTSKVCWRFTWDIGNCVLGLWLGTINFQAFSKDHINQHNKAFTITMLSWSVLEFGRLMGSKLSNAKSATCWATDYLLQASAHHICSSIKCECFVSWWCICLLGLYIIEAWLKLCKLSYGRGQKIWQHHNYL